MVDAILKDVRTRMNEHDRTLGRPFVTLTYAQSIDGSISTANTTQVVLSAPETMRMTHELRALHNSILVGVQTILADNPRLTARLPGKRVASPQPVILDSKCRVPPGSAIFREAGAERVGGPIIFTGKLDRAGLERKRVLENNGKARILEAEVEGENGWIKPEGVLRKLSTGGVDSIMVEGGGRILTSFLLNRNLVDYVIVTICPIYIAGGVRFLQAEAAKTRQGELMRLMGAKWTVLGGDVVLHGTFL